MRRMIAALLLLVGCTWAPLDTTGGAPTRWRCGPITYTTVGGPAWFAPMVDTVAAEVSSLTARDVHTAPLGNVLVLWTEPVYPGAQAETEVHPWDGPYTSAIIRVSPRVESVRPTIPGRLATIRHEWGHVMGLAHVPDPSEVMHPSAPPQPDGWGPGTRDGLAVLGRCP